MLTVITAIVIWLTIGGLVLLATIALSARSSPEALAQAASDRPKKMHPAWDALITLIAFFTWPNRIILIWRALQNKKTPLELIQVDQADQKAKLKARKDAREEHLKKCLKDSFLHFVDIKIGKAPCGVKWAHLPKQIEEGRLHVRVAYFLANGKTDKPPIPFVTHFARKERWRTVTFYRGVPDTETSGTCVYIGVARSLKEAQKCCNKDTFWLDICTPATLDARDPKFLTDMGKEIPKW